MMAGQREGQTWLSLRESWQRAALTEREPLKGGQGGDKRAHPRLACRLGRFAAERHRRSLTPSHAQTFPKEDSLPAWEGDGFI